MTKKEGGGDDEYRYNKMDIIGRLYNPASQSHAHSFKNKKFKIRNMLMIKFSVIIIV